MLSCYNKKNSNTVSDPADIISSLESEIAGILCKLDAAEINSFICEVLKLDSQKNELEKILTKNEFIISLNKEMICVRKTSYLEHNKDKIIYAVQFFPKNQKKYNWREISSLKEIYSRVKDYYNRKGKHPDIVSEKSLKLF